MKLHEIIFSPTGGTKAVADALTGAFGCETALIDLCDPSFDAASAAIAPEDVCIIAVPSYGGRVPALAVNRLLRLHGNGARAVLVAVYGNRDFEDTLLELKDAASAAEFVPFAAISAIAEHSIARQFAAGRPDADDKAELASFAERIVAALPNSPALQVPGNFPYKEFKASSAKPLAGDGCTGCGLCAESCPVSAIPAESPDQTNTALCISCMRCISVCPVGARGLDPAMLSGIGQMLSKVASVRKANQLLL